MPTDEDKTFTAAELKDAEREHWPWSGTPYCYCSIGTSNNSRYVRYDTEHLIDVMRKNRISKEDDNGQAAQ